MTYWILIDGHKVGEIKTKERFDTIAQSKIMGVFAEMHGINSLRGVSMKVAG